MVTEQAESKFSSRYIEQWINDTLKECQHLNIPGVILKTEQRLPVNRYGIDRITLTVRFLFHF